ncbi:MAG: 16S rRNA (guanine(527)-N(7))-methyltransferase RsmG [bacterium]|nr:16S rRNA (guanine(527)-N(7))-methyltransferase RsmG [bacterium]
MSEDSGTRSQINAFLSELSTWAKRINLVGSTDPAALAKHVSDSLSAAEYLSPGSRVVDLGSGAGFPGIPLAIARADVEMTLVEIREKRVHFLRHCVRTLGLGARVLRAKIEEPPAEPPAERYDVATLRAVAIPSKAVEIARPWVKDEGEIWVWVGSSADRHSLDPHAEISLGKRGSVLRISAASVSRGTH